MQQSGCDQIGLLLSKYADGEAAPTERGLVDTHVAACNPCAAKLLQYREMAAIFSGVADRAPEPHLRVTLFSQIERIKADEERAEHLTRLPQRAPLPVETRAPHPLAAFLQRLRMAAGSVVVAATTLFALIAVVALAGRVPDGRDVVQEVPDSSDIQVLPPPGLPTVPVFRPSNAGQLPSPIATEGAVAMPRTATKSATASLGSTAASLIELQQPTPVFERGEAGRLRDWHVMRDPQMGYSVKYPPNWWTYQSEESRLFYPWSGGGTQHAPYWLDLSVGSNPDGLDAVTANEKLFNGTCTRVDGAQGDLCRRGTYAEGGLIYDELYAFSPAHIYTLRLIVPTESEIAPFDDRWGEAQAVYSRMSGSLAIPSREAVGTGTNGYAPVPFLNGSDLWVMGREGSARQITWGHAVRQFALSPDLRWVAYLAGTGRGDPYAQPRYLYVADLENPGGAQPRLLWDGGGASFSDLAWYGDRELVVVATGEADGLALYRVDAHPVAGTPGLGRTLLVSLDRDLRGVRGLAVSPDRQLITFLAPLGEKKGTSLYGVRPDGTDLRQVLKYDRVAPPAGQSLMEREDQALKSYVWTSGQLEYGGYSYGILFTCGSNLSPTLVRGGSLYSSEGAEQGPMLDAGALEVSSAAELQVVHIAHSVQGKVAFTGFYSLKDGRAEVLAGLWTADLVDGTLKNIRALPVPEGSHGIADLQWSPDGTALIYRETIPQSDASLISRYEPGSHFLMVKQSMSGERQILFDGR
jgi:hypothetical protein